MKPRAFVPAASKVFLLILLTFWIMQISAQQPVPVPNTPTATSTSDLERRVYQLEVAQNQAIESLKSSNDTYKTLITAFTVLFAIMVGIQSAFSFLQWRRESKRESLQAQQEEDRADQVSRVMAVVQRTLQNRLASEYSQAQRETGRELAELKGVDQVSKIMGLVEQTLQSRLAAEQKAREEATKAQSQLETIMNQISPLETFVRKFQDAAATKRKAIEDAALKLSQTSRQDFRAKTTELNNFVQKVEEFASDFAPLEKEKQPFSSFVTYVLGIAAHYANQPEIAKQNLEMAVVKKIEATETEITYNRRLANANYYLGLIESNFGNYRNAIDYFDIAERLDPTNEDLLTKVLTADTYVMNREFSKAIPIITTLDMKLDDTERRDGRLRNSDKRLRSRAALIKASIAILNHEANWHEEALQILESVYDKDPLYYYATATLAQVYADQGNTGDAEKYFREAYNTIERSGDLITVTEVRIKILLLMVAAMCCRHGLKDEKRAEEHLDKADALRDSLPKIGDKICTVFSYLSKLNENSQDIHSHIELIRKGNVLLNIGS